jgi:hypothetical protein
MSLSHDAQLVILGAVIALVSNLLTSALKAWLDKKAEDRRRNQEREEKLGLTDTATLEEIQKIKKEGDHHRGPDPP